MTVTTSDATLNSAFDQLGHGVAQFGNLYRAVDEQTCLEAVDTAWNLGLRYFDTAPHYGLGLSEQRIGRALAGRPRDEFVLSTKVGRLLRPNPNPTGSDMAHAFEVPDDLTRVRNFTAKGVETSLTESLDRLGLDRIDVVWLHDPDEPDNRFDEAVAGAVPVLNSLRDQGVIRAWGVGTKDAQMAKDFVETTDIDLVMLAGRYTLLEQEEVGLMAACAQQGVGVVDVGVFNSGILATDEPPADATYEYGQAPDEILARARQIAAIARDHAVRLPQAAIAFPRRHPAVVNVCLGMRSSDQVRRNVELANAAIPEEFWSALVSAGLMREPGA